MLRENREPIVGRLGKSFSANSSVTLLDSHVLAIVLDDTRNCWSWSFGVSSSRKHDEAVGGDHYICRGWEAMQRRAGCIDTSAVARHNRVHPIVIDVAVEYFTPPTGKGKTNAVVVPCIFRERRNHNHILPAALQPALKGNYAVLVVNVKRIHVVPAQRGIIPA